MSTGICEIRRTRKILTISCGVHDDEASVNIDLRGFGLDLDGVGMTAQSTRFLEQMNLMIRALQRPQCSNTRAAAPDYGYLLSHLLRSSLDIYCLTQC
jgi:hypothetical protein